jgi:hypothetical protein
MDDEGHNKAKNAVTFSINQGLKGAFYGFTGSTIFSLLANRYCKQKLNYNFAFI